MFIESIDWGKILESRSATRFTQVISTSTNDLPTAPGTCVSQLELSHPNQWMTGAKELQSSIEAVSSKWFGWGV